MAGEVIGPLLGCSRVALTADGYVGAALVFDPAGEPPLGVPWVGELFRHPDAPSGVGASLLAATLDQARDDGLARRRAARQRREPGARALRPAGVPPAAGGRHGARSGSALSAADRTQPLRPASVMTRDQSPERRSTRTG